MNTTSRKKIAVIQQYAVENFSHGDWVNLGQLTNTSEIISKHPRLIRSLGFGDDDYGLNVAEGLNQICGDNEENIEQIIDFYDIDLWYEQKDLKKYERIFQTRSKGTASFWINGFLRVFISHLATTKDKAGHLKEALGEWGMSA